MTYFISKTDLKFMEEARKVFQNDSVRETHRDKEENLIALRMGYDRDCIEIYKLDGFVANFTQQMDPCPCPRKEVQQFAFDMEKQLKVNDHKDGWIREHHEFLLQMLKNNIGFLEAQLSKEDKDKHEITLRCANIANFAMMIADNEGEHL